MKAPLAGTFVLDLTRNLAGPFCTMILGDLGARVIKVERPGSGDDTREWRPPSWGGRSALFMAVNRNKESIAVDIDTDAGAEVVRKLAKQADVVVQSFRGGSLEKRGLGFDQLREVNPRLVYCALSAFGSRGPQRERPGYDTLVQAYSGIMSITGEPDRAPVRAGPSVIDMGAAHWAALGVLAALRLRDQTGEAQQVETSLLETGVSWMSYFAAGYLADGTVAGRHGSRHALMAPYEDFATADGHIYIAAPNQHLFKELCKVLAVPEVAADPRFASNSSRLAHRDALHELLEARFVEGDAQHWEAVLIRHGIPCSRVNTVDQMLADPQVQALEMLRDYPHPDIPDHKLIDHPVSYNGARSFRHDAAPELGGSSREILLSLGYSAAEIEAMCASGAVEVAGKRTPRGSHV